jgi:hypothetical protein
MGNNLLVDPFHSGTMIYKFNILNLVLGSPREALSLA